MLLGGLFLWMYFLWSKHLIVILNVSLIQVFIKYESAVSVPVTIPYCDLICIFYFPLTSDERKLTVLFSFLLNCDSTLYIYLLCRLSSIYINHYLGKGVDDSLVYLGWIWYLGCIWTWFGTIMSVCCLYSFYDEYWSTELNLVSCFRVPCPFFNEPLLRKLTETHILRN